MDPARRFSAAKDIAVHSEELDERGNVVRDASYQTTEKGVFVAGDAGRGQSLIVWAIAEGRAAAAARVEPAVRRCRGGVKHKATA